jgi:hypothetical protein
MKIQMPPIMPWVVMQKLCEEAVYAATATKEEDLKEKKRKEWLHYPGWKFGTIIYDVDGECLKIEMKH